MTGSRLCTKAASRREFSFEIPLLSDIMKVRPKRCPNFGKQIS
jgi:hypothetical protein